MINETGSGKIKNPNYLNFLKNNEIRIINEEDIQRALKNVRDRYVVEGRALIIALYYTGARPNEVLQLTAGDIYLEGKYIKVKVPGSKGGRGRIISLRPNLKLVKILYGYSKKLFPNMLLFPNYRNNYTRLRINKKGDIIKNVTISDKLRWYFKIWFDNVIPFSIPPYYLRHNRFSKWSMAGVNTTNLQALKGAQTADSIKYYIHMSKDISESAAKVTK